MIDKTKDKWWEQLQYQCPNCEQFLCFKLDNEDEKKYYKKCDKCGFKESHEIQFAEYKHENGKVYLKSNKYPEFIEVELKEGIKKGKKFLKVTPKYAKPLINNSGSLFGN